MDNYHRAMLYQYPEKIPVRVSLSPATRTKYGESLIEVQDKYPQLFGRKPDGQQGTYTTPATYHAGRHVDAWGCVWDNISEGYEAIVTGHPVKTREDMGNLAPPAVDAGLPHGLMFLRLLDLRGFEEVMIDFAEEPPELDHMVSVVRDYNVRQVRLAMEKMKGDVMVFGDDNGMQHSLFISPKSWRKYLKPSYKAIFKPLKDAGKYIYMHSDGCIHEIIPDFADCGADIINPQVGANGIDNLVRTCKGRVCIDLDLDRQFFPYATPGQVREHVRKCVEAMYMPEGGLMLIGECAADIPLENIDALCAALAEFSEYRPG